ncbi:MAG: hypothetical protein HFG20_02225 [Anaerotruncus sp.]|jgi:hypothetical protein|nr:hypothetical protein [Anaerotruncus sp.]
MFVIAVILVLLLSVGYFYAASSAMESATVTVAVCGYLSEEQRLALSQMFARYAPDTDAEYDPDTGLLKVELVVYELPAEAGSSAGERARLTGELVGAIESGRANLLLLDVDTFQQIGNEHLFEDLSTRYEGTAMHGLLYPVSQKTLLAREELAGLQPLYLALCNSEVTGLHENSDKMRKYSYQRDWLNSIVAAEQN